MFRGREDLLPVASAAAPTSLIVPVPAAIPLPYSQFQEHRIESGEVMVSQTISKNLFSL
jgi:hypothetical protein